MKKISCIILAAGPSLRMSFPKQIAKFKGEKMINIVIEKVIDMNFYELIVVLGHEAEKIKENIKFKVDKFVINKDYLSGISSSLRIGILNVSKESDAAAIFLADEPLIRRETIKKVIDAYNNSNALIVAPSYKGEIGHPVVFDKELFKDIIALEGDVGAKKIIFKYKENALIIEVDDGGILIDIDTPSDLEKFNKA
jgi:Uncharacterized MobA-related protein, COG2068